MTKVDNATASLSIIAQDLSPDEITVLLKCVPTRSFRAGDVKSPRHPEQHWKHGGWLLETTLGRQANLEAQIADLLGRVTKDVAVWQRITKRFSVRIFCGIFMTHENEGFGLTSDILAQLASYGLSVDFDLYGAIQSDEDE